MVIAAPNVAGQRFAQFRSMDLTRLRHAGAAHFRRLAGGARADGWVLAAPL